jgi:UDP-N-acetylglucosamine diphosphorylase / glucose-1-phosphate thymidylyltransferase / UDP-N-acetylgalactosamine diphosphorylase / glucosamine-1-phosphate N-acetyltransferase / galactosamine-1-phosphate N-acetyltransferase
MISIQDFIEDFPLVEQKSNPPWEIMKNLPAILKDLILHLDDRYTISDGVAIHKSAIIEGGVVLKSPIIIDANCFIAANAYLRGGVYLGESVTIGPGCEIKTSIISSKSSIAHFNFIGDSIIGYNVNFEAGALTANHHNDKPDKRIYVCHNSNIIDTGVDKFGSLIGDHSKIGANAVLSPGTILPANSIVKRLELVDQQKNK